MKVKKEGEKVDLKLSIQKTKIMASSPLFVSPNRWGNSGNSGRLYFWGLQNHCRWWLQPWNLNTLVPWEKSYRMYTAYVHTETFITLPTKVCLVKAMVFPVVMYRCESWTIKKAEHQIIDAFELWCWRRLLRVSWTSRRSNKSILKEISPEYSLEGLILKLKLQYFGHLMQRTDSLGKTYHWCNRHELE